MPNRRRSERFQVALPIWLKDGQGGERTLTANVSSHGIAVVSPKSRPLRQYIELEIALPEPRANITVTAVVARHAEFVESSGVPAAGLGLDFFLFDARAKTSWQHFLRRLRTDGLKIVPPVDLSDEPSAEETEHRPLPERAAPQELELTTDAYDDDEDPRGEDAPTFIIKPRDLGRLWAFYRGELAKGRVRIETPIGKPDGAAVELLVVHPSSQAEWSLPGYVAKTKTKDRSGRPVLEINLLDVNAELKAAFRNFVATGHGMIEEDIDIVDDTGANKAVREDPPRLESVVIDLDALDESDVDLPSGIIDAPPRFVTPVEETPSGLVDFEPPPPRPVSVSAMHPPETPTPNPAPNQNVFASFFEEAAASVLPGDPADAPTPAPDEAPGLPPGPPIVTLGRLALEELRGESEQVGFDQDEQTPRERPEQTAPDPKRLTGDLEAPPPADPVIPPHQATPPPVAARAPADVVRLPTSAIVAAEPNRQDASRQDVSRQEVIASVHEAADAVVGRARGSSDVPTFSEAHPPGDSFAPSVRKATPSGPRPLPAKAPPPPRSAYSAPVVRGAPEPAKKQKPHGRELPDWIVPRATALSPTGAPPQQDVPVLRGAPADPPPAANTPVPPGTMYDFEEEEAEDHELPIRRSPVGAPSANGRSSPPPLPPSARRAAIRSPVERENLAHKNVSTAGIDPDLDRDIALARARVVRSPHSVTACYRLSMLLMRRGDDGVASEALESLKKVMTLEPNHPGAHHKIAELLARRGDYSLAAEHLGRARRLGYRIDPDLERIVTEGARSSS